MKHVLYASKLSDLLEVLYLLVIDYVETGDAKPALRDTGTEIKNQTKPAISYWGHDLSALKDAMASAITGRNKAQNLALLGEELRQLFPQYRSPEFGFSAEELELLKAFIAYLRTDNENALIKLRKWASYINNPFISTKLAPKVRDQSKSTNSLRRLIKQLVGRDDTRLTSDEVKVLKDTNPEGLKQYRLLVKDHNESWADALSSYIRSSGNHVLPYPEVVSYLEQHGFMHSLLPGFTGLIDDRKRLYTRKGQLIDGMPSPMVYHEIRMNNNFGREGAPDYVFVAVKPDGGAAPFYTADYKKAAAKEKFAKVANLTTKMSSIRSRWLPLVKKFDIAQDQCVASVILEILFEFSARVGTVANATEGKPTFGISTLLVKHVYPSPNGDLIIRYSGKAGVKTVHKIMKADPNQRWLIKPLQELMANKGPKDRLFTVERNSRKTPVGPAMVNRFFKACGAGDVTVHKLRTFRGTQLFHDLMVQTQTKKPPKTEREALDRFNKMAEIVGKQLNHMRTTSVGQRVTGATALGSYIDVNLQILYWRDLGMRPPRYLEKFDDTIS